MCVCVCVCVCVFVCMCVCVREGGGGVCLSKGLPVHIIVCLSISRLCGV